MKADFGSGCIRLYPTLLATAAFVLSMIANFWCQSVKFDPLVLDSIATVHFGLFSYSKLSSVDFSFGSSGSQLFSTGEECSAYDRDSNFDNAWKAARAFAIIATVLGAIVMLGLWLVLCFSRRMSTEGFWNFSIVTCLVVVPFCQGLTFLILRSDICGNNPVLGIMGAFGVYEDDCQLDTGGIINIVATIAWCLTGVLLLAFRDRLS
mgnify:CR=1 FL=1